MINAGGDISPRGKGKTAEESKLSHSLLIWAQAEHVCDCRGVSPRCAIKYL